MGKSLGIVPALEYFHYDSKTSLNPSPLSEGSSILDLQAGTESPETTAESAIYALEQKSEKSSNIALFARPRLEKIGAVTSLETKANKLRNQFSQLSKHFEKSSNMLLETQKSLEEWSKTFESKEIDRLSREIGQFFELHNLINKSFSERFENIAFKFKPLIKQEFKRDEDLAKLVKSRREKEEITKRCRDQSVITQQENKVEYRYQAVRSAQTLLEKRVREDLRPSLFSYVYIMKNSAKAIDNLLKVSTLDMKGFDGVLTDKGNLIQAQLNFSRQGLLLNVNMELINGKYYSTPNKRSRVKGQEIVAIKNDNILEESSETESLDFADEIAAVYQEDLENQQIIDIAYEPLKNLHTSQNIGLVEREIPNDKNNFNVKDNYHRFAETSLKHQNNIDVGYDNSNTWAKD